MNTHYLLLFAVGSMLIKQPTVRAEESNYTRMVQIANLLEARDTREQARGRVLLRQTTFEESKLISMLDDMNMRTNKPGIVSAAITLLGQMKSTNAVGRIAELLVYNEETGRNFKEEDWFRGRCKDVTPAIYASFRCPAKEALVKIGQPSVGAILRLISEGRWKNEDFSSPEYQDSGEKYNYAYNFARWALLMISEQNRPKVFEIIESYKKTLADPQAVNRIDEFISFCRKDE